MSDMEVSIAAAQDIRPGLHREEIGAAKFCRPDELPALQAVLQCRSSMHFGIMGLAGMRFSTD
jgi:hypothetical protein